MKSPIYNLSCLTKLFACWFLLFSKTIVFIEVFGSAGGLIYRAQLSLSAVQCRGVEVTTELNNADSCEWMKDCCSLIKQIVFSFHISEIFPALLAVLCWVFRGDNWHN